MIMRKLLFKSLACLALLNSAHSPAADKYDAEAVALTRAAAENGVTGARDNVSENIRGFVL